MNENEPTIEVDCLGEPDYEWDTPMGLEDDNPVESDYDDYDDSMDGDHDSAMESCGWGTDESYGYFGNEE